MTPTNYTQGYSKATTSSHAARTIHTDAAFLISLIKPSDRILDVGCGPGTITTGFAALVPEGEVIGIDISDEVLASAKNAIPKDLKNVSFQTGNLLEGLPFPDGHFDIVFSSQLFPHLASVDMRTAALAEMRRVVKSGGIVATRDAAELHFYPRECGLDELLGRNMVKVLRQGMQNAWFPGGEMPALYRKAGFAAGNLTIGAGTTVHSGEGGKKALGVSYLGRLSPGDPYLESWKQAGISNEEIEKTKQALKVWLEDPDAWYVALQAEIVGRK
ncbi:hypothetical protein ACHAQA_008175 [Verticillium albo-atrum]